MTVTKFVSRMTYPAQMPFVAITLYYLLLFGVSAGLLYLVPDLRQLVSGERLAALGLGGNELPFTQPTPAAQGLWLSWTFALSLGGSMVGAFLLMLPSSWVYMATGREKGFDQSMVLTMVILAVSVAGVVVIVRNSLALAFSLAGIVGAVRFRNSLKSTSDTLYIFMAVGVGLAAGAEALAAGAVLSIVANYLVLLLWRADYGVCELGTPAKHLLHTHGDPAHAVSGKKKKNDFNAVVLIRTKAVPSAQEAVEPLFIRETKRWRLAEVETNEKNGETLLKYLVRLRRKTNPEDFTDAVLSVGGKQILGAKVH